MFTVSRLWELQSRLPQSEGHDPSKIKKIELKLQELEHDSDRIDSESEKQDEVVEQTDDGELLVIQRALQTTVAVEVDEQRRTSFKPVAPLMENCVS